MYILYIMQVQDYLDILTAWIYMYKLCFSNNIDIGTTGSIVIEKISSVKISEIFNDCIFKTTQKIT